MSDRTDTESDCVACAEKAAELVLLRAALEVCASAADTGLRREPVRVPSR